MVSISPLGNVRSLRSLAVALFVILALSLVWLLSSDSVFPRAAFLAGHGQSPADSTPTSGHPLSDPSRTEQSPSSRQILKDIAQFFIDFPLNQRPYRNKYGELGRRTRILRDAIAGLESSPITSTTTTITTEDHLHLEQAAASLFPFLKNQPRNSTSQTPLSDLRSSIVPGSQAVVIPTGDRTIRYAAHLIAQLRQILDSTLPIQIVYAGDADLSPANREHLAAIPLASGPPLEFLDIYTVFDDATLLFTSSASGGWAVKPFAALGSRYEKVIVLDADAVFLQRPEALLSHPAFLRTGALLFHDRLLWQHAFADRHEWWRGEIRRPSGEMEKSRVWTEDYAEECDSGVVVLDKGRLEVFMGLLHTCWQNMFDVRDDCTYRITYGDKETWWMGLEMAGSGYEFSGHYGGIVGWEETHEDGKRKVCSFVIAHVDAEDRLLWYNGGLLKNKLTDPELYEVPAKWMIDADWLKGGSKEAMSCMVNGEVRSLIEGERTVLVRSIEKAREMDVTFHNVFHNRLG
ncbi:Glycosyltransferase family 71 protein [Coniochaeta hoffmannii]|uniref:Glycosyltransferase family 71 protein n=1 Tax=Coniochaeta hoffmannii TaxID=91930 RepID=A0AA38S4R1_9PEZI|nr:Glycosyltransferase family 71 protein [Coniochaeta hoffmannii]